MVRARERIDVKALRQPAHEQERQQEQRRREIRQDRLDTVGYSPDSDQQ